MTPFKKAKTIFRNNPMNDLKIVMEHNIYTEAMIGCYFLEKTGLCPGDSIYLSPRKKLTETFGKSGFWDCLFHEMAHATGHPKRLNRMTIDRRQVFGSLRVEYINHEELVANHVSENLLKICGYDVPPDTTERIAHHESSRKYLLYNIEEEINKATDYILNGLTF